jgi:hypothetical protein
MLSGDEYWYRGRLDLGGQRTTISSTKTQETLPAEGLFDLLPLTRLASREYPSAKDAGAK